MATEDIFNGALAGLTVQQAFFNTVAARLGNDETLVLLKKTCTALGEMQGQMVKQQAGPQKLDAGAAWALVAENVFKTFGITYDVIKSSPDEVVISAKSCPVYTAGLMLGLDNKALEAICRNGSINFTDSVVKQLNPDLKYEMRKFRSSPDDFCEEVICKV
jgi:hypothetical protein